jgi:CheY-like chemotaxis protein
VDSLDNCFNNKRNNYDELSPETVESVRQFNIVIARQRFSVMVSDIGMPGTDGYDLINRVRSLDTTLGNDLPAIALTAYSRDEDRRKAIESGFQAYATKPVEPGELVDLVVRCARA